MLRIDQNSANQILRKVSYEDKIVDSYPVHHATCDPSYPVFLIIKLNDKHDRKAAGCAG